MEVCSIQIISGLVIFFQKILIVKHTERELQAKTEVKSERVKGEGDNSCFSNVKAMKIQMMRDPPKFPLPAPLPSSASWSELPSSFSVLFLI